MTQDTSKTVGVDISKAHLDVHEWPSGRSKRFPNDTAGFQALARWIGPEVRCVVYESTGPWHRAMEEALAARLPLARVNAMRARRFAQALGQEAKTDAVDARILARMGEALPLRRVDVSSPTQRQLEELISARDGLVKDRTAARNRSHHARHPMVKRHLRQRLAQIERQIRALDGEFRKLLKADPALARKAEVLTSIPGMGPVTVAGPALSDAGTGTDRLQGGGQLGRSGAGGSGVGDLEGTSLHPRGPASGAADAVYGRPHRHSTQSGLHPEVSPAA